MVAIRTFVIVPFRVPMLNGNGFQIVWPVGLFDAKMSTNGSRVWITGLIIFSYRFFYILFKPAIHQKYCKRCKFVASVGRPKGQKGFSFRGGFAPRPPL